MIKLQELSGLFAEHLAVSKWMGSPAELYDPISYSLNLGGKRIRPLLLLLACDMFKGDARTALDAALGIEMFHNFTLLHDDIMDNAPLRRGQATVYSKWNSNIAILSGDAMFAKSVQLVSTVPDHILRQVINLFCETAVQVCEGQQLDMNFERLSTVSISDYEEMITKKTAVLLACSLQIGALIAGAGKQDAWHLYQFGKEIGIAFQLQDDILDAFGEAEKFGKQKGGDIIAAKKTFLLLKAHELANTAQKNHLQKYVYNQEIAAHVRVENVLALYNELGIKELAELEMERFHQSALQHLAAITVAEENKIALFTLAESLLVREQ